MHNGAREVGGEAAVEQQIATLAKHASEAADAFAHSPSAPGAAVAVAAAQGLCQADSWAFACCLAPRVAVVQAVEVVARQTVGWGQTACFASDAA